MFSWASHSPPYEIFISSLLFGDKQCKILNESFYKQIFAINYYQTTKVVIISVTHLTSPSNASQKIEWDDIPNDIYIKQKDDLGKWIECNLCHIKILIRSQFCFTEWVTYCEGVKHCKIANSETVRNVRKIETYF